MYYRRRALLALAAVAGGMFCAGLLVKRNIPEPEKPLTFPYALDSAIVLEQVVGYEGAFLEKDDEEVVDVAALIVKNTSDVPIETGTIRIQSQEEWFEFQIFCLPPGKSALTLEQSGKIWIPQPVYLAHVQYDTGEYDTSGLLIQQMEGDVLAVTNTSRMPVENIRVFHKNWSKEADMFLGGIAYETQVGTLQPGQFVFLKPHHYITGVSQIVYVKRD